MTVIGLKTSVVFFVVIVSDRYATWRGDEVCPCDKVLHLDPDPHYTFSADFPLRFVIFLVCKNITGVLLSLVLFVILCR